MASPGRKLTDCPSNLKEAIDWILRVTGKDGGGVGQNGTKELANAVSALLDGVEFSETGLQKTLSDIKETLKTDDGNGLIGNMAAGLADFIGYQSSGSGGEIGDKGIAVPQSGTKKPFEKRETAKGIYGCNVDTGFQQTGHRLPEGRKDFPQLCSHCVLRSGTFILAVQK
ncbi:variant erythrocyte surface antigen-1, alpha subunit [Babesia caballi]|uniref:Variant erythrocyte surface antigen-1, alpha subunit n=1 Tax=Babesia caballi TaxID=5871 RepID=A0AAV4M1B9_BABCB|nr:variant erythrocyte surface antigen-1, alpha subunit [Babesia caballi]